MASTAQQIWAFFTSKGLSPSATAGIMGNLQQESSLNPNAPGGGLAQWGGSRLTALDNYAASQGESPSNLSAQLNFMWGEMQSGQYINLNQLNTYDAQQAAYYVSQNYEKPTAWAANNTGRENYAQGFYNEFTAGGPAPNSASYAAQNINASIQAPGSLGQFSQNVDSELQFQPVNWQTVTHPGQWFAQNFDALGLRISLVLLGLILVAFALVKVVGGAKASEFVGGGGA